MSDKDKRQEEALTKAGGLLPATGRPNLLDTEVKNLTPSERKDLEKRVLHEQVNLDVKSKDADGRFINSSRDMARDVQLVRGLEDSTRGDYTVDGRYETASGETRVNVRRNNNMTMMVIAVVVGLVLLFLLNR
ncbi:MAG: hypothetical protein ACRD15_02915 [Vicinamibacterales bacterium]